jgi:Kef-type K+ transport system membrane component KefB/voltage-gated potassium channel Kch
MLVLIGLELRPALLWKMRRLVLGLGSLQVILSALAIGALAMPMGLPWKPALATGLILAMSSTAIVLQTLTEKGLLRTSAGQKVFAVLLFQDMAVIPVIALLPLLGAAGGADTAHGDASAWMAHWPGWLQALVTVGAVVLIVVVARIGMRQVFHSIARTRQREAFTGAALLLVIGVALLMTRVGLSPALGTFVAGVVLANSEYRHELESDLEPFKGLLLGLFFLGVGSAIDFGFIAAHPWLVVGGALGLMAVKGGLLFVLSVIRGNDRPSSLLFSASLAAGGEFAFVLITLSLSSGVFSAETGRAMVAIIALSMAATPLLILAAQRIGSRRDDQLKEERESDVADEGNPVIICGFGRFGHAVGRLVRNLGYGCTVLDRDSDQVELLRRIGIPVYYGDASRPELLASAGAAKARVLVIALRDEATTLLIAGHARRHYPHLQIFIRAHSRTEAYAYLDAGEQHIYRETLDSSLRMGTDVLTLLGMPARAAQRAARLYRDSDEAMVREMASHRHDASDYTSVAREAVRTLDELMRRDLVSQGKPVPAAEDEPDFPA